MTSSVLGEGSVTWLGTHYRTLLSKAETIGALGLFESVSPPDAGPPRHVHHDADEAFVVLSGDVMFWTPDHLELCGPGQAMFVPRGTEHSFKVTGNRPCRMLTWLTPGGFEGFFAEMAAGAFRLPQDREAVEAIASRYRLSFTGPPLENSDLEGEK